MTMATTDRPVRSTEMGRTEAEQITQAIKDNFDSLGAMLAQARDRKAYKALGYRSFESYCNSEFGKSISSAYQLIEDAKVLAELEARISKEYGEDVTLKFPSSHLKTLKEIENIDDRLKAIEYANKLAEAENRKATKKDLEIAVFHVSGKRSEDFRAAIQGLGFSRGIQVEVSKSLNQDRGFVTKIDKGGKIYVEFHYGGNAAIPYDAADLRILSEDEQPAKPLTDDITNKGDRVLIFSPALKGKEGTVFQWKPGKQALVMVDGQNSPVDVAYAEMELFKPEKKDSNWETDLSWSTAKQTYYYFQKEDKIYSDKWPAGLTLTPSSHELSPIEFMANWEQKFAEQLLKLFSDASPEPTNQKALGISFSKTVNELVSGKKTQTRRAWQDDYAKSFIRYFDENIPIPALDKGRHRGGQELGTIKLTQRPYQQYLSEMTATDLQEEGGMVATAQEFIDAFFEGQNKLVWVLHFEFLPSRSDAEILQENQRLREQLLEAETAIQSMVVASRASSPGDTTSHPDFLVENAAEISSPGDTAADVEGTNASSIVVEIEAELPPNISNQIPSIRNKFFGLIEKYEKSKKFAGNRKEIENLNKNIKTVQGRLKDLEKFEQLRIGQTICHQRQPMILGKIIGLDFSQGEMPIVWVKYFRDGELEKTPTSELVGMIFTVNT